MNLIENHDRLGAAAKKDLWIADHVFDGGQFTVDVKGALRADALGQGCLTRSPDTAQPGNGRLAPSPLNPL